MSEPASPRLKLRLVFEGGRVLGYGKVELLERIDATGSISAAGRQMQMSYKRAWLLVEEMNAAFAEPLVKSARGGASGGGAALTETGRRVLGLYRALEARAAQAEEISALAGLLAPQSDIAARE